MTAACRKSPNTATGNSAGSTRVGPEDEPSVIRRLRPWPARMRAAISIVFSAGCGLFAKVAIVVPRDGPAREGHMWLVRSWFIGLVAAISLLAQGASKAEPVKIRVSWIAPLSNWGVVAHGEKGTRSAHGADLHPRACPLRRNAANDHGARTQRA